MIDSRATLTVPVRFDMVTDSIDRQAKLGLICLLDGSAVPRGNDVATLVIQDHGFKAPGGMSMRRYISGHQPGRQLRAKLDSKGQFRLWTDQKGKATIVLFSDSGKQVRDILLVPGKILHPKF
jgi:hypothetical protein